MKRIIYITGILYLLNVSTFFAQSLPDEDHINHNSVKDYADTYYENMFNGWTEEQYRHYEDSIKKELYPPVTAHKADSASFWKDTELLVKKSPSRITNDHVPNSIILDHSKKVGQIVINPGTTPTGARTYEVPIDVYPGMKGFNPHLSLYYNSQRGNSVMGAGWSVTGLPIITRGAKTIYYDGKPEGIIMDNSDAFFLDGIRLIKISKEESYILYESEHGNIKAKGYFSGDIMKYFEVYYPDGNKGIFGDTGNSKNFLQYPLMILTDLKKNTIEYSYSNSNNHYYITQISYNGASVDFNYLNSRPDPVLYYSGGLKVDEPKLLKSITCKLGSNILGKYDLTYDTQNGKSFLTKIDYKASDESYNPLLFYYGSGNVAYGYTQSTTQLNEWYTADKQSMIKVVKGKFDYESGSDGLIALPNKNPYWKHYRHSTTFRHSQNRFDNQYTGDEKIFLYTALKSEKASAMPNLVTETGFVDIICADLEGKQEEYVIKINNTVTNGKDRVVFHVYRSSLFYGLSKLYTRTFDFPTVYTDADDGQSIQPKFYYTGDFNGDGKMEVMAVSVHRPFGDTGKPSKCYIFDLPSNRIIYQNHVLPYNVEFIGTQQNDEKAVLNNTDRLFVIDYDGDGKSDICHINENGVNVYTFDVNGNTLSARKVTTYTELNKSKVANRDVLPGEFNGDGLTDILVSPSCVYGASGPSFDWTVYNSKGNGQFESTGFTGANKNQEEDAGFIIQDVNADGITDLIKFDANGFNTYLAENNKVVAHSLYSTFPKTKSILVPTNINAHNYFTQLICLKEGTVTKFSFSCNDSKESLVTGVANSLGIIEKTNYGIINEEGVSSGLYMKGYGATYPYVNIQEPIPVIASSEIYMGGSCIDNNSFSYNNAVIHRQGLGFIGFEKITAFNKKGQSTTSIYEPYRYNLLKKEVSPFFENTYDYSVNIEQNKTAKIRLTGKVEKDLLKDITATFSYVYDSYGFPTEETVSYTDDITIKKTNTYSSKDAAEDGYNLGFLTDQLVTVTRGGSTYKERLYIPSHSLRLANAKFYYKDGSKVKQQIFTHDRYGNTTSISERLYTSSKSLKTKYEYDSIGRLSLTTNPLGLTNEYTYDSFGRVSSIKDHRGGVTTYTYDAFGRETSINYPDSTRKTIQYVWSPTTTVGLYSITTTNTGKPTVTEVYDALNRKVREGEMRFNGTMRYIDRLYDSFGNLQKESLPFIGNSASFWNTYVYDSYDRLISYAENSGKKITYSFDKNTVTEISNNVSTTKRYDALGNLICIEDPSGKVVYNLGADGQPSSIVAPENVITSFGYDKYRRRTSLTDPSLGTTTYEYDAAGNVAKETNADGKVIQHEYDTYNRLIKTTTPEFSTSFTYNANDELTKISTDNQTSKFFSYDKYGRLATWKESGVNSTWLLKKYSYSHGNVSSIKYESHCDELATENYIYSNGHLSEGKVNGTTVFKLSEENCFGQPTEIVTGGVTRKYDYTSYGLPSGRSAYGTSGSCQGFSYIFDAATSTLTSRKDNARDITETFAYDNLNRLTSFAGKTVAYDIKGNITTKSDIGTFEYTLAQKPYAVSGINLSGNGIPTHTQSITFTSFERPKSIEENGIKATISYNGEYDRVRTSFTKNGNIIFDRYYLGNCYEMDFISPHVKEKLYLFGDFYDAPAVYVKENGSEKIYYILRDYLGSITQIVASDGTKVQELSYDAWGRLRNPTNQKIYASGEEPVLFLGRGYTGHEHLTQFGLINMNARLYDPALGRFLSPDPYVQNPESSQNFNRYSYCLNNPLCYVDEDGEFFFTAIAIAAVIAGVTNVAVHWKEIKATGGWKGFWKGAGYFGIGALAGGAGTAAGIAILPLMAPTITSAVGITSAQFAAATMGFLPGAAFGAVSGAVDGFLCNMGNAFIGGANLGQAFNAGASGFLQGSIGGAIAGGVSGAYSAFKGGENILKGNLRKVPASVNVVSNSMFSAADIESFENSVQDKSWVGYHGLDKNTGKLQYVGITRQKPPTLRFYQHKSNGLDLNFVIKKYGLNSKIMARIWEQKEIIRYGMIKNGGILFNKRNEIAPKYWEQYGIKP